MYNLYPLQLESGDPKIFEDRNYHIIRWGELRIAAHARMWHVCRPESARKVLRTRLEKEISRFRKHATEIPHDE